ncbi:MAG: hypothetical protein A3F31_00630 [Candidatus Levybacteria bacterium RIFCSPHIGHO2_12_FULL_38_12]|nr:MAG: hypothetical protein A2770_02925 [Candidatus Levybacteria bacterium RIFCSPHIGHO2_01_FULL_38_12]OGH22769.1 MAG: hypothetical protein A3F31_00630 [Candidatus Levybacteria bacterium RIFCSPHIGHO2_12_FULL_38_12]OGH45022.1 MAG: hypothetical protein A3J14_04065 [Candidatus Levybacteria bacterium RIFCSPLOWO2_02_FULL_37_18]OGH51803.1 MAG: hypothetical protein A3G13_03310 [Candidatus Levybacteria bacterium RIFCSPLOWO2_12_FULL_37_7]
MKRPTVVLGITSGIAAFRSLELVQLLKNEECIVCVIMTERATKMVSVEKLKRISGNKVYTQLFENGFNYRNVLKKRKVDHIELADSADIVVIAPATANIIAKLACGIADDFLTTTVLATTAPVMVFPSMNVHMYENPIVRENIGRLASRGFFIFGPDEGNLACGYRGNGRLPDTEKIKEEIVSILKKRTQLKGKKILVTAGGTIEPIDGVRFITNKSSGKMGIAIAEECVLRGANVLLLRSKHSVMPRLHVQQEIFRTANDLSRLVKKYVKQFDTMYHVAAVSDFKTKRIKGKIPSSKKINLELTPQIKIIQEIKKLNPKIQLIGFKAVYSSDDKKLISEGQKKIKESKTDVIVVNDISKKDRGFEADTNEVFVVLKSGLLKKIPLSPKRIIADELIEYLLQHF